MEMMSKRGGEEKGEGRRVVEEERGSGGSYLVD